MGAIGEAVAGRAMGLEYYNTNFNAAAFYASHHLKCGADIRYFIAPSAISIPTMGELAWAIVTGK